MTIVTILPHRKIESMTSEIPMLTTKSVEDHKNMMIIFLYVERLQILARDT